MASKFITLPVDWVADDDNSELIGGEATMEEGFVIINFDHIVSYNKSSTGNTALRTSDGLSWEILKPYNEFKEALQMLEMRISLDG